MSGAKGDALEWALALLRAPGERHVLRQRPLPEGMELLLGVAAAAPPEVLAEQARRFGESETQMLEAARFYAREVLFHPQADAYRMLGVEARASVEEIKAHHRLLQMWLHPDRQQSEDDTVFAARVNSAWNRLRSPERRQAYDAALRAERPPEIFDSSGALRVVRTWVPAPEPVAPPSPWLRRWPALALLGLCGVLALLALRDMNRADPDWEASRQIESSAGNADADRLVPLIPPAEPGSDPAEQVEPRLPLGASPVLGTAAAALQEAPFDPLRPQTEDPMSGFDADRRAGVEPFRSEAGVGLQDPAAANAVMAAAPAEAATAVERLQVAAIASSAVAKNRSMPAATPASPSALPALQPEFSRVQSARKTGEQLLHYLRIPRTDIPPIWSSPAVEADTQRLRQRLHADGRARFAEAHWRIGSSEAVLESAVAGASGPNELLIAQLRWRDGYWLVTGVEMESIR
ncbi:J domain-containing protein [Thermomonas fusca]|uniref:J domain-containing protein n=1 Tax=Thermomonas fusca TaxID=215690 RepID=UPI0004205FF8|nr:DnaJ domain-containing protein [Thermomonas fusca]